VLVSHKREFVYVAPPRTASTTLHRWLSQPPLCETRWSGDPAGQHNSKIPASASGFFTFASVRHPYARAVSLWAHSQAAPGRSQGVPTIDFGQFVRDWLPTAVWFYSRGQAEYFDGLSLDGLVRAEHLEADLLGLRPIRAAIDEGADLEPIPRLNTTGHPPSESVVTPELADKLAERWPGDLTLWEAAGNQERFSGVSETLLRPIR